MYVPWEAGQSAEAFAQWTMDTYGLTAGPAAIELGKELLEDVQLGRPTTPVISIDGKQIN